MEVQINEPVVKLEDLDQTDLVISNLVSNFTAQAKAILSQQLPKSRSTPDDDKITQAILEGQLKELIKELEAVYSDFTTIFSFLPVPQRLIHLVKIAQFMQKITQDFVKIKTLENQLKRDPLTGISNRAGLEAFYDSIDFNVKSTEFSVGVIGVDLDGFKQINDRFRHDTGDKILIKAAKALSRSIRWPEQEVARFGGDEFSIVLSAVPTNKSQEIAQNIFNLAKEVLIKLLRDEMPDLPVESYPTFSMGASFSPYTNNPSYTDLSKIADIKLYLAKTSGRNQIVI